MKILYKLIYLILILITPVLLFELYSHSFVNEDQLDDSNLWAKYTQQELDTTLSNFHIRTGSNCMEKITPTWHHKIGFKDKDVNFDCLKKHFSNNKIKIAFFGGSVMESTYYKNYLTSIDWQVINDMENVHSINFAQSGSRLSNELSSFIEMLKYSKPDIAVFLDGANEFNSIKYNDGMPDEDFYWTVWAKKRIEDPHKIYLDKIIEKSATAKVILVDIFKYVPSNLIKNKKIKKEEIIKAANDYIHIKNIIKSLCKINDIECLFFLQPIIHTTEFLGDDLSKKIKERFLIYYPNNEFIYKVGYNNILNENDVIDLSNILSQVDYAFIDEFHLNKNGSKIIAEEIRKNILKILN